LDGQKFFPDALDLVGQLSNALGRDGGFGHDLQKLRSLGRKGLPGSVHLNGSQERFFQRALAAFAATLDRAALVIVLRRLSTDLTTLAPDGSHVRG